jgi:hypothetical protein
MIQICVTSFMDDPLAEHKLRIIVITMGLQSVYACSKLGNLFIEVLGLIVGEL